ncbi:hypothetical protein TBK1r_06490 [Stieleria magnilauensis]|uniref:Uncharacterized protein n=1 Tax=Stieleria magnilauensis TaxID=2527963 RepID=A0ABX5XPB0_9BACT|nr:hypothetical protein TBK1r_06490 [Planctomycetes bacterium TBK1r]
MLSLSCLKSSGSPPWRKFRKPVIVDPCRYPDRTECHTAIKQQLSY